MHVEIGYRKICHLANCIQLVKMHLSSNLRTGLMLYIASQLNMYRNLVFKHI